MDVQWWILFILKATVLLVAGLLAAAALRNAAAGARHVVWLATLAGVLLLPALLRFAPVRLEVLPAGLVLPESVRSAGPTETAPGRPASRATASVPASLPVAAARAPEGPSPSTFPRPTPPQALLLLWLLVAGALLARLTLGRLAARRVVRAARPLDDPQWTRLVRELADRLDLAEVPALVASDRVAMPFASGAWRSTIVLPAEAAAWSEDRRQVVLLHELAHVKRRDLLGQELGRLACAAYWFHPLAWTAARRLRAESERACDDLVLACGARASDYAGHLLDILTAARGRGAPVTALPMARSREFEGRLLAILDPDRRRRALGRAQAAGLLAALAAVFVVVAAAAPLSPAESSPSPSVSTAPAQAEARPAVPVQAEPPPAREPRAKRGDVSEPPPDEADERTADDQEEAPERPRPATTQQDRDRRDMVVSVLRTDPDANVRRSAAWALAETPGNGGAGVLVAALRGDADAGVREMAAWALADERSEDAAAALTQALRRDASGAVRSTAAWALGHRRFADAAPLVAALADADPEVREAAIWALGQQRPERAPAELVATLRDERGHVRLLAAWTLGEILDPATAPALRAAFAKEEDVETRRAIFRALAFLGDRDTGLLDRAAKDKDPEIRSRAVLMLGGLGPGIWPWPWPWPQPRPMP